MVRSCAAPRTPSGPRPRPFAEAPGTRRPGPPAGADGPLPGTIRASPIPARLSHRRGRTGARLPGGECRGGAPPPTRHGPGGTTRGGRPAGRDRSATEREAALATLLRRRLRPVEPARRQPRPRPASRRCGPGRRPGRSRATAERNGARARRRRSGRRAGLGSRTASRSPGDRLAPDRRRVCRDRSGGREDRRVPGDPCRDRCPRLVTRAGGRARERADRRGPAR